MPNQWQPIAHSDNVAGGAKRKHWLLKSEVAKICDAYPEGFTLVPRKQWRHFWTPDVGIEIMCPCGEKPLIDPTTEPTNCDCGRVYRLEFSVHVWGPPSDTE